MVSASAGLLLGIFAARDIWRGVSRRATEWQVLLALGVAFLAIVLRELGVWRWTFAQAEALITVLCFTIAIVTGIAEHRKNVRVYLSTRRYGHYVFIPNTRDA
jgi:uncharacterized membrane protein YiaA